MKITIELWKYNYSLVVREFWIMLGIIVLAFFICIKSCNQSNRQDFDSIFNEAIEKYENNTGIKIYPYGRRCLRNASLDCKTVDEVYSIIVQNEKWFKTK